jgi:hypothetical protein
MTTNPDPDQIRQDIQRTQGELGDDVNALTEKANALTDKYNPRKAVNRRANRIRDAFGGARDKVMGTATSASHATSAKAGQVRDRASQTASDVGQAASHTASDVGHAASQRASDVGHAVAAAPHKAREQTQGSPLAAGLIAFGAGMLISSLLPASDAERRMAGRVKNTAADHSGQIKQGFSGAAQQMREGLREPTQHAAESVKSAAGQAVSNVRDQSQWAAKDVKNQAQQAGQNVQSQQR